MEKIKNLEPETLKGYLDNLANAIDDINSIIAPARKKRDVIRAGVRAKETAKAKRKADAEVKAKAVAEAKMLLAKEETAEKARKEAEAKTKANAEAKAKRLTEAKKLVGT